HGPTATSITSINVGWNTWESHSMTLRAGNGQIQFIPTMLLGLSTSGVPAWQVGKSSNMKRASGGPMGNIAGCCTAKSRCVTNMEKSSSGMDRAVTSRITNEQNKRLA